MLPPVIKLSVLPSIFSWLTIALVLLTGVLILKLILIFTSGPTISVPWLGFGSSSFFLLVGVVSLLVGVVPLLVRVLPLALLLLLVASFILTGPSLSLAIAGSLLGQGRFGCSRLLGLTRLVLLVGAAIAAAWLSVRFGILLAIRRLRRCSTSLAFALGITITRAFASFAICVRSPSRLGLHERAAGFWLLVAGIFSVERLR